MDLVLEVMVQQMQRALGLSRLRRQQWSLQVAACGKSQDRHPRLARLQMMRRYGDGHFVNSLKFNKHSIQNKNIFKTLLQNNIFNTLRLLNLPKSTFLPVPQGLQGYYVTHCKLIMQKLMQVTLDIEYELQHEVCKYCHGVTWASSKMNTQTHVSKHLPIYFQNTDKYDSAKQPMSFSQTEKKISNLTIALGFL